MDHLEEDEVGSLLSGVEQHSLLRGQPHDARHVVPHREHHPRALRVPVHQPVADSSDARAERPLATLLRLPRQLHREAAQILRELEGRDERVPPLLQLLLGELRVRHHPPELIVSLLLPAPSVVFAVAPLCEDPDLVQSLAERLERPPAHASPGRAQPSLLGVTEPVPVCEQLRAPAGRARRRVQAHPRVRRRPKRRSLLLSRQRPPCPVRADREVVEGQRPVEHGRQTPERRLPLPRERRLLALAPQLQYGPRVIGVPGGRVQQPARLGREAERAAAEVDDGLPQRIAGADDLEHDDLAQVPLHPGVRQREHAPAQLLYHRLVRRPPQVRYGDPLVEVFAVEEPQERLGLTLRGRERRGAIAPDALDRLVHPVISSMSRGLPSRRHRQNVDDRSKGVGMFWSDARGGPVRRPRRSCACEYPSVAIREGAGSSRNAVSRLTRPRSRARVLSGVTQRPLSERFEPHQNIT